MRGKNRPSSELGWSPECIFSLQIDVGCSSKSNKCNCRIEDSPRWMLERCAVGNRNAESTARYADNINIFPSHLHRRRGVEQFAVKCNWETSGSTAKLLDIMGLKSKMLRFIWRQHSTAMRSPWPAIVCWKQTEIPNKQTNKWKSSLKDSGGKQALDTHWESLLLLISEQWT